MTTEEASIPLDRLAGVYIKIRERISALTKDYDAKVEELKAQQDAIALEMKDVLRQMGVRSVNTAAGTIIMTESTRYFPSDWDEFKKYIRDNDLFDLMEKRVAQGNMEKYLKANPDNYPPGLQSEKTLGVSVRKPTGKH